MEQTVNFMWSNNVDTSKRGKFLQILPSETGSNFNNYFENVFLKKYLDIEKEYGKSQMILTKLIDGNIGRVCEQKHLDSFLKIIEDNGLKSGAKAISQAVESAKRNIQIFEEQGGFISEYFS